MSRRGRVVTIVLLFLLGMMVRQRVAQMDELWFQPSWRGAQGLALYLLGSYAGSAHAYREHHRRVAETAPAESDPARLALLRGDAPAAAALAEREQARSPDAPAALLTTAEAALALDAPERALAALERLLTIEPGKFNALLLASVARARLGQPGLAIDALNRGLRGGDVSTRTTSFLIALETVGELEARPARERPLCLLANYPSVPPSLRRVARGHRGRLRGASNRSQRQNG